MYACMYVHREKRVASEYLLYMGSRSEGKSKTQKQGRKIKVK